MQVLCERYWPPEGGTVCYGLIQVTTVSCKQGPDYFINSINLRQVRRWRSCGWSPSNPSRLPGLCILPPCSLWNLLWKAACVNEAKRKCLCGHVPERLSGVQDYHAVLLPFLAGPGRPQGTGLPLHLHRTRAAGLRGLPAPGSGCGALQVGSLQAHRSPSANTLEQKICGRSGINPAESRDGNASFRPAGVALVFQCRRGPVGDVRHVAVADAAVREGDPARCPGGCGGSPATPNVDGSESGQKPSRKSAQPFKFT